VLSVVKQRLSRNSTVAGSRRTILANPLEISWLDLKTAKIGGPEGRWRW
jgi:hypothetical protein